MRTVYTKLSRAEVMSRLKGVPKDIMKSDEALLAGGAEAIKLIHREYMVKAKGGTDIIGGRWVKSKKKSGLTLIQSGRMYNSFVSSVSRGIITIKNTRSFARYHHHGTRRMPKRELWPDPKKWPDFWWKRIVGAIQNRAAEIIVELLR